MAELLGKARDLANLPLRFPSIPRYADLGIRRRPHGNYGIFYQVDDETVIVIHILHGAQDYDALLFPDEP